MKAKLPKGYRVTVAPCRAAGQREARFLTFRVWFGSHLIVSEVSHGLVFESRDKAREAGVNRAWEFAALNPSGPYPKIS